MQRCGIARCAAKNAFALQLKRHSERQGTATDMASLVDRLAQAFHEQPHAGKGYLLHLAAKSPARELQVSLVPALQGSSLLVHIRKKPA